MTKEQLRKFIKDTRGLIRGASNEKKVRLLKLIKEAKQRCEQAELAEMELDEAKISETLDSKFATAALAGALAHAGAVPINNATKQVHPNQGENTDYLEEK